MLVSLIFCALSIPIIGYLYIKWKYSYWKRLGIPYLEPKFPYGNMSSSKTKIHSSLQMQKNYNQLKGDSLFAGLYLIVQPFVFVTSLEFVKTVLVKDFNYFTDRGIYYNEKDDPISAHLFSIDNPKWKELRVKLTPTFTSGKMKYMYQTIIDVATEFKSCIDNEINISAEIDFKEILCRFTTDVIGTCAFGIECNSLRDPEAKFRQMGRKVFETRPNQRLKFLFSAAFPDLARKLKIVNTREDVADFFLGVVRNTVAYREENQIQRKDFMDLLLNLKNKTDGLTVEEMAAQSFVFFLAGFETSSTAMSYAIYELALNLDMQERARNEVLDVIEKHGGTLTYEAMLELKYVEQIINESLRKYPPLGNLFRKVSRDYCEQTSGVVLKKGTVVYIPVYAIHHDPEFYPNPEEFNPDRFSDDEVKKRNPYSFLPFGEGPRNCIGLRFGMMQAKIGLATILTNYRIKKSDKTPFPLTFKPNSFILTSDGELFLDIERL